MPANNRRPPIEEARELIALVGALRENGDTIDPDSVAARLGTTHERAGHLLDLLLDMGSGAAALPLALGDDDASVTLMAPLANTVRGQRARLTQTEAQALDAAFDAIGLSGTDDLRARIAAGYWPVTTESGEVSSLFSARETTGLYKSLAPLAQAIIAGKRVEFDYTPVEAAAPGTRLRTIPLHRRHVGPFGLRHKDGKWYLDAYDLDRRADRRFRVDRIDGLTVTDEGWKRTARASADDTRTVRLTFTDPGLLDLFDWHDLRVLSKNRSGVECEIPWYPGGQWLPRHIAACGNGVEVDDPELARKAAAYAIDLHDQGLSV
ncbi:MAG: WYL domain-containing protein [Olegusella sp.]|nr:WYL domain-containing protein [Olegusella sp.]